MQESVRLWWWDLDRPEAGSLSDQALLSAEEQRRAARYIVPHAARRFTASRAALRRTLATLRGCDPAALPLETGVNGKPFLPHGPEFNLSHSGPVALFAVADFPVGVDVEAMRSVDDGLAGLVFTDAEQAYYRGLPAEQREAAFFRGWTRKEALIKAVGGSIAALQSITVLPDHCGAGDCRVQDLIAPPGYTAAVAGGRSAAFKVGPICDPHSLHACGSL